MIKNFLFNLCPVLEGGAMGDPGQNVQKSPSHGTFADNFISPHFLVLYGDFCQNLIHLTETKLLLAGSTPCTHTSYLHPVHFTQ